jgi:hypothetical protein
MGLLLSSNKHAIASKGGQASSGSFEPGSERAREAGRKGGRSSGGRTAEQRTAEEQNEEEDENYEE